MNRYHLVCVAGTFDRLHAGHEALLSKAFVTGENVLIGLTSDVFVSAYKALKAPRSPRIRTYEIRKNELLHWLKKILNREIS